MKWLRSSLGWLKTTPIHPQWLLGRRQVPTGVSEVMGRMLDVGAADQWLKAHCSGAVDYVALDYPATGRDLYGSRPHVFADAASIPFADACFDGVCCLEVLEHVPNPLNVIVEICRVLKPSGRAWVSMPFLYPLHDAPYDFQRFTEYGLRRDAERAGLKVVSITKTGHAIRAAGLLASLAIAGGVYERRGVVGILLLPVAMLAVLVVNLTASLASRLWPDWGPMATGYVMEVRKP
ncbi:class I SAM-dependent methyltransferase [Dyella soli]|uniref:Class I SAM-dependent methyltransferase n=1 Tax=Dyella soli TaxID=522319 RepID=A0A4R0YX37_9GAMM|nr:class I SAM-dependent methyltransferase [Dyella soli]TCI10950.1 class I SAM-dependent methyltransferase [Dyella soli]